MFDANRSVSVLLFLTFASSQIALLMVSPNNKVSRLVSPRLVETKRNDARRLVFSSPCGGIDGPQRLAFGNKGFILCDGERLFVESCPGGTIWDDFNKACAWPDQEGVVAGPMFDQEKGSSVSA